MKLMQSVDDGVYIKLKTIADTKGLSVQELLRAVVIPYYLEAQQRLEQATVRMAPSVPGEKWAGAK